MNVVGAKITSISELVPHLTCNFVKNFSDTSILVWKLVNHVNHAKLILMKNHPTNQAHIIYQLMYHIFSYFVIILYCVSSIDSNISKFILIDLDCYNGNFFIKVLHNTYAS